MFVDRIRLKQPCVKVVVYTSESRLPSWISETLQTWESERALRRLLFYQMGAIEMCRSSAVSLPSLSPCPLSYINLIAVQPASLKCTFFFGVTFAQVWKPDLSKQKSSNLTPNAADLWMAGLCTTQRKSFRTHRVCFTLTSVSRQSIFFISPVNHA